MDFLEQQRKENQHLSLMISQLHDAGLISNEQKIKIEEKTQPNDITSEILTLLMTMESAVASKMFMLLRSIEKHGKYNSYSITHNQVVHPLKTDTVIRNVFRFLNLKDIKNCRLVNKKWRDESEVFLRKRSRINFNCYDKTPIKFNITFPRDITLPFSSFWFRTGWDIDQLEQFFEQQGPNVLELGCDDTTWMNDNNDEVENYDISHWIAPSPIKKLNLTGNNKLAVSLNRLISLKYINLNGIRVNIWKENGNRIAPVEITLNDLNFYEDGNRLNLYRINEEIDFSNAEMIEISSIDNNDTDLTLDLAEMFNVKVLNLCQVLVLNWTVSKCSAEAVFLESINFLEKTEMKIKKLFFDGEIIDLYGLPSTLEILSLRNPAVDILCTQPIILPRLTTLFLKINNVYNLQVLTHFESCEQLINIILMNDPLVEVENTDTVFLDLDWIPSSVNCITMNKVVRIQGDLDFETLTLYRYSLSAATKILSKITPEKLVLLWDKEYEANDSIIKFVEKFPYITISIGPIKWEDGEFEKSRLANYVDKMGKQYIFKNRKGKSVEFDIQYPVDYSN